jgi:hypothetical protein
MNGEDVKCLGFKDMNELQLEALMRVTAHALNLADACCAEAFEEVMEDVDEMARLFGAHGVTVEITPKIDY